jgi:hypothetical protein
MHLARRAWFAAALAAAAALGYFMLFRSPEAEALATLDRVARVLSSPAGAEAPAARRARLERELAALCADDIAVELDGSTRLRGRNALVGLAADSVAADESVGVELSSPELRVDGSTASARGDAVLVRKRPTGVDRDVRRYHVIFRRGDGRWIATSVEVARATHEEPEARP